MTAAWHMARYREMNKALTEIKQHFMSKAFWTECDL
jgi:hypothetical protein